MSLPELDLAIRGGRVLDGTGSPAEFADVGVRDGRIVAVGSLEGSSSAATVDATGLTVTPGFIDMHAHSDIQALTGDRHEAKVLQGVTLELIGQDGLSYAPVDDSTLEVLRGQLAGWNDDPPGFDWSWRTVGEYLSRVDRGTATNLAYLVPHGTVRMAVIGNEDRKATQDDLRAMQKLIRQGLRDGAFGLSAGLTYIPGMFADDDELVQLCEPLRELGGFYCPHHRSYGRDALQAYADCVEIARRARVPLHLAHAHMPFKVNKGRGGELLELIDRARAGGVDVTLDTYPYLAGSTYLHAFFPEWIHEDGPAAAAARLESPDLRDRLRVAIEDVGTVGFSGVPMEWDAIIISGVRDPHSERWVGSSVAKAAQVAGQRPIDFVCELLARNNLAVSCIAHVGDEDNVQTIMQHRAHMVGSDGILVGTRPHPRGWGTFPRYLGVYARDLGVVPLEEMVRKMTSAPARRLGLSDRGLLEPGMVADIVCFDAQTVRDLTTYEDPMQPPEGIVHVFVNGAAAVCDGASTGIRAGRAVRSTSYVARPSV